MIYVKQFAVIISISFLGELIRSFVSLPVPGSIYGLVILFLLLWSGVLKYDSVKDAAGFLIEIMPVMFIPGAVGLIGVYEELSPMLLPLVVIVPLTTWIVMIVSGRLTQVMLRRSSKSELSLRSEQGMEGLEKSEHAAQAQAKVEEQKEEKKI